MSARLLPVQPFDLVVFGATGDLTRRKLLPALYHRFRDGQIPDTSRIVGAARSPGDDASFRALARSALRGHVGDHDLGDGTMDRFLARLHYRPVEVASNAGWPALVDLLGEQPERIRVYYLATLPVLFAEICGRLGEQGLVTPRARVVIEKPVGHGLDSARALNSAVGAIFPEEAIYRIDHYLGKETVQNLMALRFANALFEPLWNAAHIDHVQITVAETIGVGSRAGYYDQAGALRDMVQNHMLQLLCLVAMEPPTAIAADAVRDEKLKVLKALKPVDERNAATVSVRGQYRAGASGGEPARGYVEEAGLQTATETFVALKAEVGNWRWAGTPFYLRTGKRLAARQSEIVVAFRPIPHSVFDDGAGPIRSNRLVIRLQPDEGVKLWLTLKQPGPGGMRLQYVPLDMSFAETFGAANPDAYERLLLDVVRGNQTLFMRRDEVEAAWAWIDPIREAWQASREPPKPYTAGSWGPSAAIGMIERDGRTWADDLF
jgi:glucose-6-phosphate 1-dehydrogenase